MSQSLPRIVRESCSFSERDSAAEIKARVAATRKQARETAKRIGIRRPVLDGYFDIDVICAFTDYPMYLLGPGAPQIKTADDALYHGSGRGKYTVVIDGRDET